MLAKQEELAQDTTEHFLPLQHASFAGDSTLRTIAATPPHCRQLAKLHLGTAKSPFKCAFPWLFTVDYPQAGAPHVFVVING